VVRYVQREDRLSFILHSDLAGHDADAIIAREADYFARLGVDVEWKVYDHDAPADLLARLVAHGFAAEEAQFQMVLPLADMPARLAAPLTHDVRRLTQGAEFESFMQDIDVVMRDVWQEGYVLAARSSAQPVRVQSGMDQPVCGLCERRASQHRLGQLS
jgi:hypothetical protein